MARRRIERHQWLALRVTLCMLSLVCAFSLSIVVVQLMVRYPVTFILALLVSACVPVVMYLNHRERQKHELFAQRKQRVALLKQRSVDTTTRDSRYIPQEVRIQVMERCQGKCVECGTSSHLEYDHVIPLSRGGATSANNLQILCRSCNMKKYNHI